jgi:hypothetical protein
MASSKRIFEADIYAAGIFASGVWRGRHVPGTAVVVRLSLVGTDVVRLSLVGTDNETISLKGGQ